LFIVIYVKKTYQFETVGNKIIIQKRGFNWSYPVSKSFFSGKG